MDTMASALWDLFGNQKLKGLAQAMRQTLLKLEKAGHADARWANAMGELAQADRDFAAAAKFFKMALDESGKPEYELNLGNALFYAGDLAGAKSTLQSFLTRYPDDSHGLVNLANCHLRLGELAQAKSLCLKGLGRKGVAAASALWNCLGQAAHLEGDDARAYECFGRAYAESPDYVDALFNRANMAYRLGRVEEALGDLELCVRKDENYEAALLNAAVIHLEREDADSGKACLVRALRINPHSLDAHHLLGRMHMLSREFRLARDAFREALKADAGHIPTLIALARLHVQETENDQARGLLRRVLAHPGLGREEEEAALALLLELQEFGLCSAHLQKTPEAGIDGPRRKMLILSLWREGRTKLAISHLEKLMGQEGETAGTLAMLGRMLASSGAEPLAELRLRRALELDPSCQSAAFELSRIYMERGEGPRALSVLESLLEHHPDDPDCLYNLACCHSRLGQPEAGLKMLEKSLRNGFRDLDKIAGDADLEAIRQFKEYQQLTGHGII